MGCFEIHTWPTHRGNFRHLRNVINLYTRMSGQGELLIFSDRGSGRYVYGWFLKQPIKGGGYDTAKKY